MKGEVHNSPLSTEFIQGW